MVGKRRTSLLQDAAEASRGTLLLTKVGSSWPAEGEIRVGSASTPAKLYIGAIGGSHRGRDDEERRFQNPGTNKPVVLEDGSLVLLIGIWEPGRAAADPVLVGMDAYRRAGLTTRFSMFVPLALLADAEELGFAEHESESGEKVTAFRASRMAEYVARVMEARGKGLAWSEEGFGPPPKPEGKPPATKAPTAVKATSSTSRKAAETKTKPAAPPVLDAAAHDRSTASVSEPTLHIRPKVGMYSAFARLNYKPWFAIAEFVDNAVQSFLTHRAALKATGPLDVEIIFDDDEIVIRDYAAGIPERELPRAFSPSQPPPDASGLSEFGLGMKAAACWFAHYWTVRTSALGEPVERLIRFDVDKITASGIEHIPIESKPAKAEDHFTVVTLRNLRVKPQGRALWKVKDHLSSIYRVLAEKGLVRIKVTSASESAYLNFEKPALLNAPYYRDPSGEAREWRTEFNITLGENRAVRGWAGILEKGSASRAGLSVFRRDRLIQGSGDETYRPSRIFKNPNSFTYQRLVGDLFVDGFEVSHTKDGIEWAGLEDEILTRLHKELSSMKLPILAQAEGHRSRQRARDLPASFGAEALVGAVAELEADAVALLAPIPPEPEAESAPAASLSTSTPPSTPTSAAPDQGTIHQKYEFQLVEGDERFDIALELIRDVAREFYGYTTERVERVHRLHIWLNLSHPFSESYVNNDENTVSPLIRLIAAMVFAEYGAQLAGIKRTAAIRQRINDLLRDRFGDSKGRGVGDAR